MGAQALKIIAILSMLIDHFGIVFAADKPLLYLLCRGVGRLAFPIFAFLIARGYGKTRCLLLYTVRLGVFAMLSQLPYYLMTQSHELLIIATKMGLSPLEYLFDKGLGLIPLCFGLLNGFEPSLNVGFTLILGTVALLTVDRLRPLCTAKASDRGWLGRSAFMVLCYAPALFIAVAASLLGADYGFMGVALIVLFGLAGDNRRYLTLSLLIFVIGIAIGGFVEGGLYLSFEMVLLYCLAMGALPLIAAYDANKYTPRGKRLFYFVYPLHMLLYALIYWL